MKWSTSRFQGRTKLTKTKGKGNYKRKQMKINKKHGKNIKHEKRKEI